MNEPVYSNFARRPLDDVHGLWEGALPTTLLPDEAGFENLWDLHPAEFHDVAIHGRVVKTPRWQQAYHRDYEYTGSRNNALPVPALLQPYWDWSRQAIDNRLNGILLNWYDGRSQHYIGKHRDSRRNLIEGSPIVTISLGETRTFRMRPWPARKGEYADFEAANGVVFIMPYATNLTWTHEVPKSKRHTGRRISVTLRAFNE